MGRRAPRRRLRLPAWSAALLLAFAIGCAQVPQAQPGTLPDRLNNALRQESQQAFLDNFTADPAGAATGRQWFSALSRAAVTFSQPDGQTLSVRSMLPGDRREATWTLRLDLEPATGRIRGLTPTPNRPIWTLGATDVTPARHGTLLSAGLDEAARQQWADRLDRASVTVAASSPAGGAGWTGGLVVEIVADASDFEAVTNEPHGSASALTTCSTGTPRVVVNPAVLDQPAEWLDSTLVHEAVHVATDSACVPVGRNLQWAVEGLAESVAAGNDPATATRNQQLVAGYLRDHPVPRTLPDELTDLTGYALAQLAVEQVQTHLGAGAKGLLDRAIHDSRQVTTAELERVTGWYTAELERIGRSG